MPSLDPTSQKVAYFGYCAIFVLGLVLFPLLYYGCSIHELLMVNFLPPPPVNFLKFCTYTPKHHRNRNIGIWKRKSLLKESRIFIIVANGSKYGNVYIDLKSD